MPSARAPPNVAAGAYPWLSRSAQTRETDAQMRTHQSRFDAVTTVAPDFVDVTDEVADAVSRSGIHDGQVTVFCGDLECSLLLQERESGLLIDIEQALHRLGYNGGGRRSFVGTPSVVVPVRDGRMQLGVWQRVLLVELGWPRPRSVAIQIVGE